MSYMHVRQAWQHLPSYLLHVWSIRELAAGWVAHENILLTGTGIATQTPEKKKKKKVKFWMQSWFYFLGRSCEYKGAPASWRKATTPWWCHPK